MSKTSTSEGTKIAQAAKELNVTSVTIRRYLSEFNIETETDENGIKVLPAIAMEELLLVRQLKDEGLNNPKVMEQLEEQRGKRTSRPAKTKVREGAKASRKKQEVESEDSEVKEEKEEKEELEVKSESADDSEEQTEVAAEANTQTPVQGRSKHSLTCQTCGKVFEHMNPRLRDCLECYRSKRKERRRGGNDKHKNVIQHPLVKHVINKSSQQQQDQGATEQSAPAFVASVQTPIRNYRKAIEETRHITANLKRRLERPDLQDGERRWLEQVYAYQLILHQGWRHLAEYKSGSSPSSHNISNTNSTNESSNAEAQS